MARRRSRRRKSSYSEQVDSSGVPTELVVEELSPRARRLAESGVIDLAAITGSGEGGRITSGDILHAARVMEMEQSVARIETVGRESAAAGPADAPSTETTGEPETAEPEDSAEPEGDEAVQPSVESATTTDPDSTAQADTSPDSDEDESPADTEDGDSEAIATAPEDEDEYGDEAEGEGSDDPTHFDATTSSAADIGSDVIEVPPNPWDAYNGSSEGLSESALPGAEQSWGEAEANIAAIAEEAAAQVYGRPRTDSEPAAESFSEPPEVEASTEELITEAPPAHETDHVAEVTSEPVVEPEISEPEMVETGSEAPVEVPTAVVAALSDIEAAVDPEPASTDEEAVDETAIPEPDAAEQPQPAPREAMMDFGTLELVDPESVWAEGAEDFAPWFLAHSKQLGDVLGLEAGLSEARQFTTKSATGVLGRDDTGEEVVVVSSQSAVADDSDLGRALGMAASSGAATVALVSAKFNEDQLKALSWLNNQTRSGVRWYGIEMRVVRIADSPAAMLFDLVAAPPSGDESNG